MGLIREAMSLPEFSIKHVDHDNSVEQKALHVLGTEFIRHEDADPDVDKLFLRGSTVVLKADDEVCGFMTYKHINDIYHVSALGVAHQYRGKGYGKALLNWLIKKAKADPKIKQIKIGVKSENSKALGLYKSCGFKVIEEGVEEGMAFVLLGMQV